jgi:ATP-dependent protease Clp ATPase subunit
MEGNCSFCNKALANCFKAFEGTNAQICDTCVRSYRSELAEPVVKSRSDKPSKFYCSFCNKNQCDVAKIVVKPSARENICSECVDAFLKSPKNDQASEFLFEKQAVRCLFCDCIHPQNLYQGNSSTKICIPCLFELREMLVKKLPARRK